MRWLPDGTLELPAWSERHTSGFIGSFYVKHFKRTPEESHEGHAHFIDHPLFLYSGSILLEWSAPDGRSGKTLVHAPNFIPIKAEVSHKVTPVGGPADWFCLFSEAEGEKVGVKAPAPYQPVPYYLEREDG